MFVSATALSNLISKQTDKQMKKYILFLFSFMLLLSGCDVEGDAISAGFIILEKTYKPNAIRNDYRVTFNGDESEYVSKNEATVRLEVFSRADSTSVLVVDNLPVSKEGVTLVKPVGKELALYAESNYKELFPQVFFSGDASQYAVLFGNGDILLQEDNYIPVEHLPGNLRIVRTADSQEVHTQEITAETGRALNLIQLSATEFLNVPDTELGDVPLGTIKIRIFYTADAFPGRNKLLVDLYLCDKRGANKSFFRTIELTPGYISEYFDVDYNHYGDGNVNFLFDLKDEDGNTLAANKAISIGTRGETYKAITYRIRNTNPADPSRASSLMIVDLLVPRD
jgi:hypothetical protein